MTYAVMGGKGVNIQTKQDDNYFETTLCFLASKDCRIGELSELLLQTVEHFLKKESEK